MKQTIYHSQCKNAPKKLSWLGKVYKFSCNKGNNICYVNKADYDTQGSAIIVEYRKNKRPCDAFYVLFSISGINDMFGWGDVCIDRLKGVQRNAKPIY